MPRRVLFVSVLFAVAAAHAADHHASYYTPAGTRPAVRTEAGPGTVLPGGRLLTPYGSEYTTGPGPFGLAVSPSGKRVVTSDGGLDRFSLTFLEQTKGRWAARSLPVPPKGSEEWKSTFMGLAFDGEDKLYASEGESGQVRLLDPASGRTLHVFELNAGGYANSYSGDLAFDAERQLLYVVDQANFRVAIFDTKARRAVGSVTVGRLPFAIALAPSHKRIYVTNIGMFSYKVLPGADSKRARETGLEFPAFGFPSAAAADGAMRTNAGGIPIAVPGLGDPNLPQANSLCVVDVEDPKSPKVVRFVRTGLPFGEASLGGSSPAGVLAAAGKIFVSNSTNDTISVVDPVSLVVRAEIPLRIPGLEQLRGVLPIGLGYHAASNQLLVAEGGINAIGVIDAANYNLRGHIPSGWFPTRVVPFGDTIYVSNAKGHGIGPNATLAAPLPHSFQMERRRGSISRYSLPKQDELPALTRAVLDNDGFVPSGEPGEIPPQIRTVVFIVKENRTFAEVFGDLGSAPKLARFGAAVTPNHHAIAKRFAMSDNFYADSEVSVDGHHWLVGSYPNEWTESTMMAAYGGAKGFRLTPESPGRLQFTESNSSVHPEDTLEAGTLWHHLERNHILFRNYGEGFELAGVDEGVGLKPTGARYLTNVPMPDPLYRNTDRAYPNFNTNIPDQFRATQFIKDVAARYRKFGRTFPRFLFIHLPMDHTADPRPADGYPTPESYVADNDLALGRIVESLSHSPWWRTMLILVTEDDAGGGVDPVDAHRTVLLAAGPWVKPGCVAHTNTSFVGMIKTALRVFKAPPLNLFDAAAPDLSECLTNTPDFRPYNAVAIDPAIFDPAKAREPLDPKPSVKMDDPAELKRQHDRLQRR